MKHYHIGLHDLDVIQSDIEEMDQTLECLKQFLGRHTRVTNEELYRLECKAEDIARRLQAMRSG